MWFRPKYVIAVVTRTKPETWTPSGSGTDEVAMAPEYVIVLTTLPADGEIATAFARTLVEERLAACVNVMGEMQSVYAWEGLVEEEQERQIIIKTLTDRLESLWERVKELHSYEVPEFIVLPITDGNDVYLRWMKESTRPAEIGEESPGGDVG
jgi:periplasmic divalent cation tolerance protein